MNSSTKCLFSNLKCFIVGSLKCFVVMTVLLYWLYLCYSESVVRWRQSGIVSICCFLSITFMFIEILMANLTWKNPSHVKKMTCSFDVTWCLVPPSLEVWCVSSLLWHALAFVLPLCTSYFVKRPSTLPTTLQHYIAKSWHIVPPCMRSHAHYHDGLIPCLHHLRNPLPQLSLFKFSLDMGVSIVLVFNIIQLPVRWP